MIRLTPADDAIWARTLAAEAAVSACSIPPGLVIVCKRCGPAHPLAHVGRVPHHGVLFIARWDEPLTVPIRVNGDGPLSLRKVAALGRDQSWEFDGDWAPGRGLGFAMSLIGDSGGADPYVRCGRCGDLVLDPAKVLSHLASKAKRYAVAPTRPILHVEPARTDLGTPTTTTRRSVTIGRGNRMPLDELRRRLYEARGSTTE